MSEPTSDELGRGMAALMPFVRRWHLPLNPEDMEELVYAVLLHARSDASMDQIVIAVGEQIDQFTQSWS
jgi:hypothetical protein